MRTLIGLIVATLVAGPALAADAGVSVSIGDPGFYGRIDIGDAPPPVLMYEQPVIVLRTGRVAEPVYFRVPRDEAHAWPEYCSQYGACGQQVYFVQDSWYNEVYVPHYRERHARGRGQGQGHGRGHRKDARMDVPVQQVAHDPIDRDNAS